MDSVQLIETYSTLYNISLIVFIVGLVLSIVAAIIYNIPLVIMQITGLEQRRFAGKVRGSYEKLSNNGMMSDSHAGARKAKIEGGAAAPDAGKAEARTVSMPSPSDATTLIEQGDSRAGPTPVPVPAPAVSRPAPAPAEPIEAASVSMSSRATTILSPVKRDVQEEFPVKPPDSEDSDFLIVQRIYCVHTEETI